MSMENCKFVDITPPPSSNGHIFRARGRKLSHGRLMSPNERSASTSPLSPLADSYTGTPSDHDLMLEGVGQDGSPLVCHSGTFISGPFGEERILAGGSSPEVRNRVRVARDPTLRPSPQTGLGARHTQRWHGRTAETPDDSPVVTVMPQWRSTAAPRRSDLRQSAVLPDIKVSRSADPSPLPSDPSPLLSDPLPMIGRGNKRNYYDEDGSVLVMSTDQNGFPEPPVLDFDSDRIAEPFDLRPRASSGKEQEVDSDSEEHKRRLRSDSEEYKRTRPVSQSVSHAKASQSLAKKKKKSANSHLVDASGNMSSRTNPLATSSSDNDTEHTPSASAGGPSVRGLRQPTAAQLQKRLIYLAALGKHCATSRSLWNETLRRASAEECWLDESMPSKQQDAPLSVGFRVQCVSLMHELDIDALRDEGSRYIAAQPASLDLYDLERRERKQKASTTRLGGDKSTSTGGSPPSPVVPTGAPTFAVPLSHITELLPLQEKARLAGFRVRFLLPCGMIRRTSRAFPQQDSGKSNVVCRNLRVHSSHIDLRFDSESIARVYFSVFRHVLNVWRRRVQELGVMRALLRNEQHSAAGAAVQDAEPGRSRQSVRSDSGHPGPSLAGTDGDAMEARVTDMLSPAGQQDGESSVTPPESSAPEPAAPSTDLSSMAGAGEHGGGAELQIGAPRVREQQEVSLLATPATADHRVDPSDGTDVDQSSSPSHRAKTPAESQPQTDRPESPSSLLDVSSDASPEDTSSEEEEEESFGTALDLVQNNEKVAPAAVDHRSGEATDGTNANPGEELKEGGLTNPAVRGVEETVQVVRFIHDGLSDAETSSDEEEAMVTIEESDPSATAGVSESAESSAAESTMAPAIDSQGSPDPAAAAVLGTNSPPSLEQSLPLSPAEEDQSPSGVEDGGSHESPPPSPKLLTPRNRQADEAADQRGDHDGNGLVDSSGVGVEGLGADDGLCAEHESGGLGGQQDESVPSDQEIALSTTEAEQDTNRAESTGHTSEASIALDSDEDADTSLSSPEMDEVGMDAAGRPARRRSKRRAQSVELVRTTSMPDSVFVPYGGVLALSRPAQRVADDSLLPSKTEAVSVTAVETHPVAQAAAGSESTETMDAELATAGTDGKAEAGADFFLSPPRVLSPVMLGTNGTPSPLSVTVDYESLEAGGKRAASAVAPISWWSVDFTGKQAAQFLSPSDARPRPKSVVLMPFKSTARAPSMQDSESSLSIPEEVEWVSGTPLPEHPGEELFTFVDQSVGAGSVSAGASVRDSAVASDRTVSTRDKRGAEHASLEDSYSDDDVDGSDMEATGMTRSSDAGLKAGPFNEREAVERRQLEEYRQRAARLRQDLQRDGPTASSDQQGAGVTQTRRVRSRLPAAQAAYEVNSPKARATTRYRGPTVDAVPTASAGGGDGSSRTASAASPVVETHTSEQTRGVAPLLNGFVHRWPPADRVVGPTRGAGADLVFEVIAASRDVDDTESGPVSFVSAHRTAVPSAALVPTSGSQLKNSSEESHEDGSKVSSSLESAGVQSPTDEDAEPSKVPIATTHVAVQTVSPMVLLPERPSDSMAVAEVRPAQLTERPMFTTGVSSGVRAACREADGDENGHAERKLTDSLRPGELPSFSQLERLEQSSVIRANPAASPLPVEDPSGPRLQPLMLPTEWRYYP